MHHNVVEASLEAVVLRLPAVALAWTLEFSTMCLVDEPSKPIEYSEMGHFIVYTYWEWRLGREVVVIIVSIDGIWIWFVGLGSVI